MWIESNLSIKQSAMQRERGLVEGSGGMGVILVWQQDYVRPVVFWNGGAAQFWRSAIRCGEGAY
jgi:hypothetical protein